MSNRNDKRSKKQQQQQKNVNNNSQPAKRVNLTMKKRNELSTIVGKLLKLAMKNTTSPTECWTQFLEMYELVQQVISLEKLLQKPPNYASSAERTANIARFEQWAKENGVQSDGLRIAEFPGYGLGMRVERDIAKDEIIITVPLKVMLTEKHIDPAIGVHFENLLPNVQLSYNLIVELLKGNDSFWQPYIAMLAGSFNTILYFTKEHMEEMRGSSCMQPAMTLWKILVRQYAGTYERVQSFRISDKDKSIAHAFQEQFNFELFRWAVSVVMTRENLIPNEGEEVRYRETQLALVPYWDMVNHRLGGATSLFDGSSQRLECSATTDLKSGEQLFMHYGNRTNMNMMLHNGFIDEENPFEYIPLTFGLSAQDPLGEKRKRLLELVGAPLLKNSEWKIYPQPIFFSNNLLAFIRVFNMNEKQLDHWLESERAPDLQYMDCALETELEQKAWQFLKVRLALQLQAFQKQLTDPEKRLAEGKLDDITRNILNYKIAERRILTEALEEAKERFKA